MAELRAYCHLDRLQPQFASLFASACRGFLSVEGMASLFVEVVPGVEINRLSDIALKITNSKPGEMIVERRYGMLEIHSFEQEEVLHAGSMILDELGLKEEERLAPSVLATSIINKIDPYQAVIINRNSKGMLILGGDDVYLLEVTPAAYSSIAANEAEKHCDVRLVDIRFFGASGRIYMAGTESEIQAAAKKVVETGEQGILICATGSGICLAANKVKGARGAVVWDEFTALQAKEHNNANILCLAGKVLDKETAKKIVRLWLEADYAGEERHARRLGKIEEAEK